MPQEHKYRTTRITDSSKGHGTDFVTVREAMTMSQVFVSPTPQSRTTPNFPNPATRQTSSLAWPASSLAWFSCYGEVASFLKGFSDSDPSTDFRPTKTHIKWSQAKLTDIRLVAKHFLKILIMQSQSHKLQVSHIKEKVYLFYFRKPRIRCRRW